ncbi:MAG: hypothetical protein MJB14_14805 [Spirochaetes bacterium]|nr:hypothetical protein [Spirochaetota bacterium]
MSGHKSFQILTKGWFVVIALVIFIVMSFIINNKPLGVGQLKEISREANIPDLVFNYSSVDIYQILENQGETGRNFYLTSISPLDFIFPITYCLFLVAAILFFYRKVHLFHKGFILLPILVAVSDYTENILFRTIYFHYPQQIPGLVSIANFFTMAKFICMVACYLILLVSLVFWIMQLVRKKN